MKWSSTALTVALVLFALGFQAGCDDYNNTVQYDTGATLTNLSPSAVVAGTPPGTLPNCPNTPSGKVNPCFNLYIVGSTANGFQSTTLVEWNNAKLPVCTNTNGTANTSATNGCSTYVDATDMTAAIPYSFVSKPGTAYVNTWTPQSGTGNNGLSNALTFTIYGDPNPFPLLSSISPTSAAYCASSSTPCASVSITLNGSHFIPVSQNGGSSVTFTGLATYGVETAITVTSISSTQLKATIPGTYLCATDTPQINVINPPSAICLLNCPNLGGGDTNCNTSLTEPSNCSVTTQYLTITNSTAANTCPANIPPSPNPTVVSAAEERPAVTQDGRYVVYTSLQNETSQILLRDTCVDASKECTASTQIVSVATDGTLSNGDSHNPVVTSDGRYVAFSSAATNLVANPPAGRQVYLRDTCLGAPTSCKPATSLISTDEEGKLTGSEAILPSISAWGRFVAFLAVTPGPSSSSAKSNVTSGAASTNSALRQVFVRDTCLGATNCAPTVTRISLPSDLGVAEETPAISQSGRYVVYTSQQNQISQILLRDTCVGAANGCTPSTQTVSLATDGAVGNGDSHYPVMTPDGRYVAFSSAAANLVANAPSARQVYLRDSCLGAPTSCKPATSLVSADAEGKLTGTEAILPSISTSGRFIAFLAVTPSQLPSSAAWKATSGSVAANSGLRQVFVRDTCLGATNCTAATARISLQPGDAPAGFAEPVGPALTGLAGQIALSGGKTSTVFTRTVPVDDQVFLAIRNQNQ